MKNKKLRKKYSKEGMALSQIIIILLGTIAFAYIVGSDIGFVSAVVTGTFNFGTPSVLYTLTDKTAGCRLYTGSETNCYAYSQATDSWYPDTNKNGAVDDSTSAVSGLANAVYGLLVPSGTPAGPPSSLTVTYPSGSVATYKIWKDSSGKYVITWGQYLITNSSNIWYSHQDGVTNVNMGPTFNSAANAQIATYVTTPTTQTCAEQGGLTCTAQETCSSGWIDEQTRCCLDIGLGTCVPSGGGTIPPPDTTTCSGNIGYSDTCTGPTTGGTTCSSEQNNAMPPGTSLSCCYGYCYTPTPPTGEQTPPATDGVPSGVGNSVYLNCLEEIAAGNFLNLAECLALAQRLSDASGGTTTDSGATTNPVGGGEVPLPYEDYIECMSALNNAGICGGMGLPNTPLEVTPSGGGNNLYTNWQGKNIGRNILNIIGSAVEAVSLYLLLKGLESQIPALANLDPTSAAVAWLNFGEAALSGLSFGGFLALNALLFSKAHSLAAVPSIFGAAGFGAAALWAGLGAAVAITLFLIFYKQHTVKAVVFTCIPWQAPLGGNDCRKCGANGLPCSEYQCKSLGQGCTLLNSEQNGKELCEPLNEGDTVAPIMTFFNELPATYSATPLDASVVSTTGDTGVFINTSSTPDGKIPASTLLTIGVTTDEPSRCGISLVRIPITNEAGQDTINQLISMSAGLFEYNHSFILNSPGPEEILTSAGKMDLYIRCRDGNGNNATAYFVIEFEVSDVPDTSPPIIIRTDLPDNTPLPFDMSSTKLPIYVSDATGVSECKWSHNDKAYDLMEETADCTGVGTGRITSGVNAGLYKCIANLTGILNGQINTFYFRCKDTLNNVHSGTSPFLLHLIGTQPLAITSASPNNTLIKGSTDSIKVTLNVQTSVGVRGDGTSDCFYNKTFDTNRYVPFDNTGSYQSSHEIWLPTGSYKLPIRCADTANNAAYSEVRFSVESDKQNPIVVRASHENANLNIKTDEEARCVYDIVSCDYPFDSGISMTTSGGITHLASWVAGRTYYIKCKDLFNNNPQTSCSIELSTSQF